jgi:hypothetical protein
MVKCRACSIETANECGNRSKQCYRCCIKSTLLPTCKQHLRMMPPRDMEARELAEQTLFPSESASVEEGKATEEVKDPDIADAPAPGTPLPTILSAAATVDDLRALATTIKTLAEAVASLKLDVAAGTAPRTSPHAPRPTPLVTEPIHRQRALGAPADEPARLTRLLGQVSDDDDDEVSPLPSHSHTHTAPPTARPRHAITFPASWAPVAAGSVEDTQQQLARMISSISKSHVKFATLEDLAYSLKLWIADSAKHSIYSVIEMQSLYQYRDYLIHDLGPKHGIVLTAKYHALWTKAVADGEHDMFARGGYHDAESYREVFHTVNPVSSSAQTSKKDFVKKGDAAGKKPSPKKYPAGSCTNHLTSTSHNTSMCNKK